MRRLRALIQPRWFGYLGMAIVFAIACVLLSRWQFSRLDEARAEVQRIERNYERTPEAIGDVLPTLDSWRVGEEWTPVTLTGTYLSDETLLARNRPYNGNPGFEVLVPFQLDDGSLFIVDRGWVPTGDTQDKPDVVPAAPTGRVTVVARVKQGEPTLVGRSAPAGEVPSIDLGEISRELDAPTYTGAYGLLASENPAPATTPLPALKPEEDEGPHLSYAIQWLVFALFGFGGLGYAIRQELKARRRDAEEEDDASPSPPPVLDPRRRRSDADIEDELADAGATRLSR